MARKKKPTSSQRISLSISHELAMKLATVARRQRCSQSEIARRAIAAYCERELPPRSAYEAFKRSGLIGCARHMPADLSTNPEYMEGFGE